MPLTFSRKQILLSAALLGACLALPAAADSFPNRPLKLVVPFSPGGNTDVVARLVGQGLALEAERADHAAERLIGAVQHLVHGRAEVAGQVPVVGLGQHAAATDQLHAAVARALKDGRFSVAELQCVRTEALDLVSAVLAFVQRLEGLVDE